MNQKTSELLARIRRLRTESQRVAPIVGGSPLVKRLQRRLTTASTGVDVSYSAACTAGSRDAFILHISAAARHAKRTRQILQDLTHLGHVNIDITRELILEARAVEAILTASKNTARRRRRTPG